MRSTMTIIKDLGLKSYAIKEGFPRLIASQMHDGITDAAYIHWIHAQI